MAANGNKANIKDGVRKRAGAPTKQQQLQNKLAQAELKMEEVRVKLQSELTSGNETLVKEYLGAIKYLVAVSKGEVVGATIVNRMNACKMIIDRVDELKEALELAEIDPKDLPDPEEEEDEEGVEIVDVNNLIQIDFLGDYDVKDKK